MRNQQLRSSKSILLIDQEKLCRYLLYTHKIKKEGDEESLPKDRKQQKRGSSLAKDGKQYYNKKRAYTNWFQLHLWPFDYCCNQKIW